MNRKGLLDAIKAEIRPLMKNPCIDERGEDYQALDFLVKQVKTANEMVVSSTAYKILDIIDLYLKS